MMGSLQGKVVLVTGGGRRVGAAICRELAARSAAVVVHYRHSEAEALALCRELKNGVLAVRGDLSQPAQREWVFREAMEWLGRVDVLVNNAALFARDDEADPAQLAAVNVAAPLDLAARIAAQPGGGCVIHLLDSWAARPEAAAFGEYAATKRELAGSIARLAQQWVPHTRVNGVAPGPVLVPERTEAAGTVPLQQRPTPEHVAHAVAFLAENTAVTGQIVYVDGGQHLLAAAHDGRQRP
ncbi:MAG TPA: SDR family oxidoreductase [Kiritimatiellia bacterium]|jgi:NAD(P)-dependent dehydrogenase (short-subunit alcohol dehydrogenase family)|nr:MAG: Glucose 1-dehydrogenase [Verrucomicrobia bacterium ADurb.Bin018]HOE36454.1 SDR family oxidoreductase [Kiritimatiellia bacterium]HOR73566.1 SDR family oxidoreductase [Kiritimatiellia bacterium]HOU59672.1 SDR family oxidoreductase [Kiritimatiellia bacterium]HPK69932.1 SDR family oxidoreductase [Kiritimatiellia bacterium]